MADIELMRIAHLGVTSKLAKICKAIVVHDDVELFVGDLEYAIHEYNEISERLLELEEEHEKNRL